MKVIKICNKRFALERRNLLYTIWKLTYHLKNETKYNLKPKEIELNENPLQTIKRIKFDFDDYSDISIATTLVDGVLRTLKFLRERGTGIIFELFVRSSNNAEQRKTYHY